MTNQTDQLREQLKHIDFSKFKGSELNISEYTELYTLDEIKKLINAYIQKYKIPICDEVPYYPKPLCVKLSGYSINTKLADMLNEKMLISINDLDISNRALYRLKGIGIRNVGDLLNTTRYKLYQQRGFGKKSWIEVRNEVKKLGFEIPIR